MLVTFRGQKVKACGKKEATKTIFEDNLGENILNVDFFSSVTGAWKYAILHPSISIVRKWKLCEQKSFYDSIKICY